jgi:hypothetical protein
MNKEVLKYLVPVVAVLVVLESVVLISKLSSKTQPVSPEATIQESGGVVEETAEEKGPAVMDMVFGTETKELKVGEAKPIELNLISKGDYKLDALSLFVKYDPEAFDVANINYDQRLPSPILMKASTKAKLVVANFMVSEPGGFEIKNGETVKVLSFEVTPKKEGSFNFELSTSKDSKESATMFVETATSKDLPYSSSKLTISVSK